MINNKAILFSAVKPNKKQEQRFKTFLNNKYNEDIVLEWIEDKNLNNGFKLEVGNEIFDWSDEGRYNQLVELLSKRKYLEKNIIPLIKEKLNEFELKALPEEVGYVVSVGDNIAIIEGLDNARYGEIIIFEIHNQQTIHTYCILINSMLNQCIMRRQCINPVSNLFSLLGS